MIEVNGLTKKYGDRFAIDQISFSVKKGEILGFLGQNGAGKTTTMKILTGFMPATSGTAKIGGFDVFENPIEVKKRIGYLPESPPIYPELLVSEYLNFVSDLRGIPKDQKKKKMDLLFLKSLSYLSVSSLSTSGLVVTVSVVFESLSSVTNPVLALMSV